MALMSWATHVLQWSVQSACETVTLSESQKADLSSDWSLKLDSMKVESLVIAHQHGAVNTFPGLVHTARHTTRVGVPEVASLTSNGGRCLRYAW